MVTATVKQRRLMSFHVVHCRYSKAWTTKELLKHFLSFVMVNLQNICEFYSLLHLHNYRQKYSQMFMCLWGCLHLRPLVTAFFIFYCICRYFCDMLSLSWQRFGHKTVVIFAFKGYSLVDGYVTSCRMVTDDSTCVALTQLLCLSLEVHVCSKKYLLLSPTCIITHVHVCSCVVIY